MIEIEKQTEEWKYIFRQLALAQRLNDEFVQLMKDRMIPWENNPNLVDWEGLDRLAIHN